MEQGSIRLERKSVFAGALRSIQVWIDDSYVGKIRNGGVFYYKTSVGCHFIQLRMDWLRTKDFHIEVLPHNEAVLCCAAQDNPFDWELPIEFLRYENEHKNNVALTSSQHIEKVLEKSKLPNGINKLQLLIGLDTVKSTVQELVNITKTGQIQAQVGIKAPTITRHLVFTGSPGTGKTTVARIIGEIYKDLGVLSKGHFIEVDRTGLVGEYLGQTAPKTANVIQSAMGGVLFIDEAYSLVPKDKSDMYGQEAISTLLKMMEDHRDDLVVIVAGYQEEMQRFIQSNPGLKSRFSKSIHFEDYSVKELTRIFQENCRQYGYIVGPETVEALYRLISQFEAKIGELGNGRFVRNIFDRCVANQCNRLVTLNQPSEKELKTFKPTDIPTKKQLNL
jgi:Holliday junction resolvasome RuvABC ATP-dependent DNA helicase subunit